jgi:hypothetical protein
MRGTKDGDPLVLGCKEGILRNAEITSTTMLRGTPNRNALAVYDVEETFKIECRHVLENDDTILTLRFTG